MKQPSQPLSDLARPTGWSWVPRLTAIVACAVVLPVLIWHFGHLQLGGFDHSVMVDTGWRQYEGQKPYKDFFLTTPVGFYLGAKAALAWWGVRWSSFVNMAAAYAVVAFVFQAWMLQRLISWRMAIAVSFVVQMLTMVVSSYWWYNPVTTVSACLFFTAAFGVAQRPKDLLAWGCYVLTLGLLALMKPNVAGSSIVLVSLVLLAHGPCRWRVLLASAGGGSLAVAMLLAHGIDPVEALDSYLGVTSSRASLSLRLFLQNRKEELFVTLPLLALCLVPYVLALGRWSSIRWPWKTSGGAKAMLALAALVVGLLSFATDSDSNLSIGTPIILTGGMTLLLSGTSRGESTLVLGRLVAMAMLAAGAGVFIGFLCRFYYIYEGGPPTMPFLIKPAGVFLGLLWGVAMALAVGCLLGSLIFAGRQCLMRLPTWTGLLGQIGAPAACMAILILLGGVGCYAGAMRWRVKYIGPFYIPYDRYLVPVPGLEFFQNFRGSPEVAEIARETVLVLEQRYGPRMLWGSSLPVYFGPRMEFMYAALGIQSPKGLPIWWHPGISFPEDRTQEVIRRFQDKHFRTCIFHMEYNRPDLTYMPLKVSEELARDFRERHLNTIVVFDRAEELPVWGERSGGTSTREAPFNR